jgi:hypothetical protein
MVEDLADPDEDEDEADREEQNPNHFPVLASTPLPPSVAPHSPSELLYEGKSIAYACSQGNIPLTALFILMGVDRGLDLLLPDSDGCTLLHYAALGANPELVSHI